jgi:CheY-like chemotaxis protein
MLQEAEPVLSRMLGPSCRLVVNVVGSPRAWADTTQLQELLLHLARNAREAMPEGGTLTITAGIGALASGDREDAAAGPYATLHLRDTGAGMEPSVVDRIFEPFFTTNPSAAGTGLGLAAARGIVAQHGGHITVASVPGKGTGFTVYLPLVADDVPDGVLPEPPAVLAPRPAGALAGATVLVVDDEPAVRSVAARSLERGGYRVLEAEDGCGALALVAREGPPSLLLTDRTMPGLGGVELARQVRERWPAVPILFMSGYPAEELRRQGGTAAARDLIEKPFSPAELTTRVDAALSRSGDPASAAR